MKNDFVTENLDQTDRRFSSLKTADLWGIVFQLTENKPFLRCYLQVIGLG